MCTTSTTGEESGFPFPPPVNFDFEDRELTETQMRLELAREVLSYHPEDHYRLLVENPEAGSSWLRDFDAKTLPKFEVSRQGGGASRAEASSSSSDRRGVRGLEDESGKNIALRSCFGSISGELVRLLPPMSSASEHDWQEKIIPPREECCLAELNSMTGVLKLVPKNKASSSAGVDGGGASDAREKGGDIFTLDTSKFKLEMVSKKDLHEHGTASAKNCFRLVAEEADEEEQEADSINDARDAVPLSAPATYTFLAGSSAQRRAWVKKLRNFAIEEDLSGAIKTSEGSSRAALRVEGGSSTKTATAGAQGASARIQRTRLSLIVPPEASEEDDVEVYPAAGVVVDVAPGSDHRLAAEADRTSGEDDGEDSLAHISREADKNKSSGSLASSSGSSCSGSVSELSEESREFTMKPGLRQRRGSANPFSQRRLSVEMLLARMEQLSPASRQRRRDSYLAFASREQTVIKG